MAVLMPQRLICVWGLLLLLTVFSYHAGAVAAGAHLVLLVLLLALLKAQLLVDHFMGLRRVHRIWRALMAAYLLGLGALLATAYLIH